MSEGGDDGVDLGVVAMLDDVFGSAGDTDEVLRDFLANADGWLRAIGAETQPSARSEGHRAAHTLAASAAMVGAVALSRGAREVERSFAAGQTLTPEAGRALAVQLDRVRATWRARGRPG